MPYTVEHLIEGRAAPIRVYQDDKLETALRLMIQHDFSQLPILAHGEQPIGMITSDSIVRALKNFDVALTSLSVTDALVKARTFRIGDDLFDLLDDLRDTYAVLIVDSRDRLVNIVTSYDAMEYFRRRAEDIMLVEDIETMLKDCILEAFADSQGEVNQSHLSKAIEEITPSNRQLRGSFYKALQHYIKQLDYGSLDKPIAAAAFEEHFAEKTLPKPFEKLDLYDYTQLFVHKSRWPFYGPLFTIPPKAITTLLDGVRETRNNLAHFRSEITSEERERLRFCADWFKPYHAAITSKIQSFEQVDETNGLEGVNDTSETNVSAAEPAEVTPFDEELKPTDSRYAPLALHLQKLPANQDKIQLTFGQVEEILGDKLPASAHRHRAWWANDSVGHAHSQQWLEVGWRTTSANMTAGTVAFARIQEREKAYIDFFAALLGKLKGAADFPIRDASPDGVSWIQIASLPQGGPPVAFLSFSFARGRRFRVELYIDTGYQDKNKLIFDELAASRNEIQAAVGGELSLERLDHRRASRMAFYHEGAITDDDTALVALRSWAVETMIRFQRALIAPMKQALNRLNSNQN